MTRQDLNGVRTPQDLERKYDFSSIGKLKKNFELQQNNLTKVENELTDFVKATTKNLEDIQNQVDGNITTWFSSSIPTLENYPANEWSTEEEKNNHLGDLYYDRDTGYAYRFTLENEAYSWLKITDNDVTEALALANSAKDTADKKRQVFIEQPIPPYDVGDLWIKNEELYRCQTTKSSDEVFEENDWIIATKYTDDTVANQVGKNLTILSGTVTEIKNNVDELNTKMTNTTALVDEQGTKIGTLEEKTSETSQTVDEISSSVSAISTNLNNNYTNNEELEQKLEEQKSSITTEMTTQMTQTAEGWKYDVINQINTEGITKLKNTTVNIDDDGVGVSKSDEGFVGLLSNKGVYASDGKIKEDNSNVLMKVDISGALFKTLETSGTIKENGLIQKEKIEHEKYGTCQAWYWVGD